MRRKFIAAGQNARILAANAGCQSVSLGLLAGISLAIEQVAQLPLLFERQRLHFLNDFFQQS